MTFCIGDRTGVIDTEQLTVRYPRVVALDGLDLHIADGVTGLVGATARASRR